jgi:membrane protease YdiL (CAAX protease family)
MSYLDYAERGLNAGWRYALTLLVGCVLTVALGAAILLPLELTKVLPPQWIVEAQDPRYPVSFFLFSGMCFGLLALGLAIAAQWIQKKRPHDLVGAWSPRLFGLGAGIWLVALVAAALVDYAIAPSGFRVTANAGTPGLLLAAFAGLAIQTFSEEFIFRGFLTQGLLLATKRALPAAILSGLIFGAIHIPNGAPQAASATVFGIVLALIAIRTGGIAFSFGLHFANNLFGAVVLVSGGDAFRGSPGLFSQDTPHLMWWDMAVGSAALVVVGLLVARAFDPQARGSRPRLRDG